MVNREDWTIFLFVVFVLTWVLMAINAVYFHCRYQKKLDQQIMGDDYIDGGMLYNLTRLMLYAHYCLFSNRAKRAGVDEIIRDLPTKLKAHLIFHWFSVLFGCLILIIYSISDIFL